MLFVVTSKHFCAFNVGVHAISFVKVKSGPEIVRVTNKAMPQMLTAFGGGGDGARENTGLPETLNSNCQ